MGQDGRQLYADPKGHLAVAQQDTSTNTVASRRFWIRRDAQGEIQEDFSTPAIPTLEDGRQIFNLPSGWSVVGIAVGDSAWARCGWTADKDELGQWYQLDLEDAKHVQGIQIFPHSSDGYREWVTKFKVQFALVEDGLWSDVQNGEEFPGIGPGASQSCVAFEEPVVARFIRILPCAWHGHISMTANAVALCEDLVPLAASAENGSGGCTSAAEADMATGGAGAAGR